MCRVRERRSPNTELGVHVVIERWFRPSIRVEEFPRLVTQSWLRLRLFREDPLALGSPNVVRSGSTTLATALYRFPFP